MEKLLTFVLLPENEPMNIEDSLEATGVSRLVIRGRPGQHLANCLREAMMLAVTQWVPVELVFNEKSYTADPRRFAELMNPESSDEGRA